ncbi:MAG TPA: class I SAM-dependent methyltransferase [Bryobacteraceae bacterium]|jgi:SAM-dependent methyltransferase
MRPDAESVLTPAEYYDDRHARGWMDEWPEAKRSRVVNLIRDVAGEAPARILEYGCGVGVFANAMKQAMPQWEVHGCDISSTGVARARERYSGVEFHVLTEGSATPSLGKFDVIYTHHVLEHVDDVGKALARISRALKPGGKAVHIAPCANAGSLEHTISRLKDNGATANGCFHHDDSSHVRRLTSAELTEACRREGMLPRTTLFANQFWGGLDYLTAEYHRTLLDWLSPAGAATAAARRKLSALTIGIVGLSLLRKGPKYVFSLFGEPASLGKKLALTLFAIPAALFYPFATAIDRFIRAMASWEWKSKRFQPNGSEMYAVFEKAG